VSHGLRIYLYLCRFSQLHGALGFSVAPTLRHTSEQESVMVVAGGQGGLTSGGRLYLGC
jgi:hypothetical protein